VRFQLASSSSSWANGVSVTDPIAIPERLLYCWYLIMAVLGPQKDRSLWQKSPSACEPFIWRGVENLW
jgi:hypothetical protein